MSETATSSSAVATELVPLPIVVLADADEDEDEETHDVALDRVLATESRWAILRRRWRRAVRLALVVWATVSVGMMLLTYLATLLNGDGGSAPGAISSPRALLYAWDRWDANYFYLPIAASGYAHPIDASFFPLYPALTHVVWLLTGGQHVFVAGMLVAQIGAALAFVGVGLLAAVETDSPLTTLATLLLLATYPLGFFLVAPYPTGWLVASVAFALLFARCGRWYLAALATLVATLAHPSGALVAVAVIWEWWAYVRNCCGSVTFRRAYLRALASRWRSGLAVVAAAPLGFGVFAAICARAYNDPWALFTSDRANFGYERVAPWDGLARVIGNLREMPPWSYAQARVLLDIAPLLLALVLLLVFARRREIPLSHVLYVGVLLLLFVCTPVEHTRFHDVSLAAGRHVLAAVPLFVAAGRVVVRRSIALPMLAYVAALAQAICAAAYLHGAWLV